MKFNKLRRRQLRTETIIMSGGLNEIVTNIELKKGELHQCVNYMEMDGNYHGYSSILGYEAYDGKEYPSNIGAPQLSDFGNDTSTVLLLEAPLFEDLSSTDHQVINDGAMVNYNTYKFYEASYDLVNTNIIVRAEDSGEFSTAYDSAYYSIETEETSYLNLNLNWTIDFQLRPKARTTPQIIFEKPLCYKLEIDLAGHLLFWISSDGLIYDYNVVMTETAISTQVFSHISIVCKNNRIRMAVKGNPILNASEEVIETAIPGINQGLSDLTIGVNSYTGYIDEFRISDAYRWWTDSFTPPVERYTTEDYTPTINWDDEDREEQRSLITEVPGTGDLLGVHVYNGRCYAMRNKVGGGAALYMALETGDDLTAGWVLIDDTFATGGRLEAINYRWSGVFNSKKVMVMVDGVSLPRIWDETTMYLYDNAEAASIPDRQTTPRYAKLVNIFDKRVIFGYEEDDVIVSSKSDPRDFALGFGEQLIIGDDITNFRELPGESMAIICRNSVKILKKLEIPTSGVSDYTFRVEEFSRQAGGLPNSCERLLEFVLYADDRGIVTLTDTDTYGDFGAAAVSKKVNRIYLSKRSLVTTSIVDKERNQYRLYFSDGTGLVFTFEGQELKGATFIQYANPVYTASEGEDINGEIVKYFSSDGGFVYRMDTGTSFNGNEIVTEMFTSFYHYRSPRNWKRFTRMVFEMSASRGTNFRVRNVFDYNGADFPETLWWDPLLKGLGGVWGDDSWGEFTWGGAVVQRMVNYIRGYGTNMSIELTTSSKHNAQHTIHNVIVDYEQENIQE